MGNAICTVEGIIRGADTPFATLPGFEPSELPGTPLAGLIAPHCRTELALHLLIACSRGTHVFPSVHRRRDGEEFPVAVSVTLEDGTLHYGVHGDS